MPEASHEGSPPQETHQETKKASEANLFAKTIKHLKTTGQVALLSAVLATACGGDKDEAKNSLTAEPTTPNAHQTIEAMPSQTMAIETPEQTISMTTQEAFTTLRQVVASGTTAEQAEASIALDQIEKTYKGASALVQASENEQTEDKPKLIVQQKQMFGEMDIASLWQGKYESEEQYLKDLIPFYRDEKAIREKIVSLANNPQLKSADIPLSLFGLETSISAETYSNLNTRDNPQITITSTNEYLENIKDEVLNMPHLTDLQIELDPELSGGQYNPPDKIKFGPGLQEETLSHVLSHEFEHARDSVAVVYVYNSSGELEQRTLGNPDIYQNISPEDSIKLMIARNKLVLETRNYSTLEGVFSRNPGWENADLSNQYLIYPESAANSFVTEPIFSGLLESATLESQQTESTSTYSNLNAFLEGEAENLDKISAENPLLKITISALRQNPKLFGVVYGEHIEQSYEVNRPASIYYNDLEGQFSAAVLTAGMFMNSAEINKALNDEVKTTIKQKIITQIYKANSELIAELSGSTDPAVAEYNNVFSEIAKRS